MPGRVVTKDAAASVVEDAADEVNEVLLRGRLSVEPERRELPSGDELWTCRVVVRRPPAGPGGAATGAVVDALECAAWTPRARRSLAAWHAGDVVEVVGRLRRRFYRTGAGAAVSRVEVEVVRGKVIRRATAG